MFTDGTTTYSCDTLVAGLILQSTPVDWWCLYWIHGDMDPSIYNSCFCSLVGHLHQLPTNAPWLSFINRCPFHRRRGDPQHPHPPFFPLPLHDSSIFNQGVRFKASCVPMVQAHKLPHIHLMYNSWASL